MDYQKPSLSVIEQIAQLRNRGLIINNEDLAFNVLTNISYYRLAGYWWPMQADKVTHSFKPNSKFEDVLAIYDFDRELRTLLFSVIERIEIGFRTRSFIIYPMNYHHGGSKILIISKVIMNIRKH